MEEKNSAKVAQINDDRQKVAQGAIDRAFQADLPAFMDKMRAGNRPDVDESKGALFGLALLCGHNIEDTEARLRWLEHSWAWRLFHRSQRPKRA
jgi:hypothetical protein